MKKAKKDLAVITISQVTSNLFKRQLNNIFEDKIMIKYFTAKELQGKKIKSDLILTTKSLIKEKDINDYIFPESELLIAKRSLNISYLEELIKINDGSRVLLINDTQLGAYEAKSLLEEVGINNLKLIPYYPGKKDVKNVKIAINLGEERLIPPYIKEVINIGSRVIDITTVIEIAVKMDIMDNSFDFLSSHYIRELVTMGKRLNNHIKYQGRTNKKLDTVINHVHDGIIYINQDQEIEIVNQKAEEIFEMNSQDIVGRKVKNTIPNTKLNDVLDTKIVHRNALQDIGDKKIVSTRVPVEMDGKIIGALATFKDVTDVKKLEEDLRFKMQKKGYVAKYNFENIVGKSKEIERVKKKAQKLAKSESTILIQGESGTGKELFSQSIHNYSKREHAPFVAINCAAFPDNLLESELFGYEGGAFTGAKKGGKPGVFEQAHTGTIFLDEIGDIPAKIQARLLRVLQEKEIMRIGGTKVIPIDIRVIAATNKDLYQLVQEGEFREDLYYRLNVLSLYIPPLRKRREDILMLIEHFLKKFNAKDIDLSKAVVSKLYNYDWSGNVRELENCIEYIVQICQGKVELHDLPSHFLLRSNSSETKINKVELDLANLGEVEEYIFILNELYLAKQLGEKVGRREIAKNAEANNLYLSAQMVRSRLNKLEEQDMVEIGVGRQGTTITQKGVKTLKSLSK